MYNLSAMRERPHYSLTLRETARNFGIPRALLALALRVLKIRPVVLLAREATVPHGTLVEGNGVRPATPDDAELFDNAGFPGLLQRKLAEGPGWIKLDQGRLVAWCFLGMTHSEISNWLVVRTDNSAAVWGMGTWVHRDYRGGGVAAQVRGRSFAWYRDKGYREQFSWINLTNYSSLRSSYKLGAKTIGRITFIRLLGTALVYDGHRWHLGRWTASRPLVLSIDAIRRDRPDPSASFEPVMPRTGASSSGK